MSALSRSVSIFFVLVGLFITGCEGSSGSAVGGQQIRTAQTGRVEQLRWGGLSNNERLTPLGPPVILANLQPSASLAV